jgi:hypothetical protein
MEACRQPHIPLRPAQTFCEAAFCVFSHAAQSKVLSLALVIVTRKERAHFSLGLSECLFVYLFLKISRIMALFRMSFGLLKPIRWVNVWIYTRLCGLC